MPALVPPRLVTTALLVLALATPSVSPGAPTTAPTPSPGAPTAAVSTTPAVSPTPAAPAAGQAAAASATPDRPGVGAGTAHAASAKDPAFTVVLDAGHGGEEMGAEGKKGVVEKEITLDVAKRLKALLDHESGMTVLLTRDADTAVALDDRTALANRIHADLFLSIHVNSAPRRDARGAETYFLASQAKDEEIRTLAAIENNAAGVDREKLGDRSGSLELVLWDLAQSMYLEESSDLAEAIQKELNDALGVRDRGVKRAPFRVLMGATMPSVLVEIGFISNPAEEASLAEGDYRDRIAGALSRAVIAFRASPRGRRIHPPDSTR